MLLPLRVLEAGVLAAPGVQTRAPSAVPEYVRTYAPMVHLFSEEAYLPSDISAQVANTLPDLNFTTAAGPSPVTLDNLSDLNNIAHSSDGQDIYLTSASDPTTSPRPAYLYGVAPDSTGQTPSAVSAAIITVAHADNDLLDAFYMYFYAFNFGGVYFSLTVGNHVGDWEHNMIRFNATTGLPLQVWYSQHASGQAFEYAALEKYNDSVRPVTYSANGTHANYATPGTHDHTIPGVNLPAGPIEDYTDAGTPWDPTANAYFYSYDASDGLFTAYGNDSATPVDWLYFTGHWGDDQYPISDPRQHCTLEIDALCEYTGGPTGPADKDLVRTDVCPDSDEHCDVSSVLLP